VVAVAVTVTVMTLVVVAFGPPVTVVARVVRAGAVGAGRPATRVAGGVRRAGPCRVRGGGGPDAFAPVWPVWPVAVRPAAGPVARRPGRLVPDRALGGGADRPRGRRLLQDRGAGRDLLLAGGAPLDGHDHASGGLRGLAAVSCRPGPGPAAGGRLGGGAGAAGRDGRASSPRRLDLDHVRAAQVGRRRLQPARHRAAERLHQQLARRHHGRQRGPRQRRHPEGDDQRCSAARRHARRSPAA
jgi:hypothetical protein